MAYQNNRGGDEGFSQGYQDGYGYQNADRAGQFQAGAPAMPRSSRQPAPPAGDSYGAGAYASYDAYGSVQGGMPADYGSPYGASPYGQTPREGAQGRGGRSPRSSQGYDSSLYGSSASGAAYGQSASAAYAPQGASSHESPRRSSARQQPSRETWASQQVPTGGTAGAYSRSAYGAANQPYASYGTPVVNPTAVNAYGADYRTGGSGRRGASVPTPPSQGKKSGRSLLVGAIGLVIGLLVGGLVAFFVFGGAGGAPRPVAGSLQESQLGTVVGTYRYNNQEYKITAHEAILASKSLDAVRNADGTYQTPTTDMVVSAARNAILAQLVKDNGIEVSSDEVLAYARETVGTDNMTAVAAYFDMDEDQARQIMGEAAAVKKLRETVVGTGADAPVPPSYPADGDTEVGNATYADYILGLIGNNWDTATQSWANTSNPYYAVLQDKVFAPGSANYEAAQAAYAVAYDLYTSSGGSSVRSSWTAWLNQYLDEGSIAVATLRA